jgi:AbrB family looped-hinge helix DNA binding protein
MPAHPLILQPSYLEKQTMPSTRFSTKGQVVVPKEIRDKAGVRAGREYSVECDGEVIILRPKAAAPTVGWEPITADELMARRFDWAGPDFTREDIREAAMEGAVERFERSLPK